MDLAHPAASNAPSPADTVRLLVEQTAQAAAGDVRRWLQDARERRDAGRPDEAVALLDAAAHRFPNAAAVRHDLARIAEARLDWPAAERFWRDFIAIEPATWWGYTNLADALREQGRIAEAESVLSGQFARMGQYPGIFASYARLAEQAQDWRAAAKRWDIVASRFPYVTEGYAGLGRALRQLGRPEEAHVLLSHAAARFPSASGFPLDLARLAEERGDWPVAERYWHIFVSLEPDLWWGHSCLANALRELGRVADGEAVLAKELKRFADQPAIFIVYAQLAERARDWPAAKSRWENVRSRFPAIADGAVGQARALRGMGRIDDAWDLLVKTAERFPSDGPALVDLARMAEARRNWATAEQCWRGFVSIDPLSWSGQVSLANVLREQGRMEEAEAVLNDASGRFPGEAGIVIEQARLADRRGDWPRAASLWAEVAKRLPQQWEAAAGQARALREQGEHANARLLLIQAAERFPAAAVLLRDLARVAEAETDWALAESAWRRFIALDPTRWWAYTGLANAVRRQGDIGTARALLTDAAVRFPTETVLLHDLARMAEAENDWADATLFWKRFMAVDRASWWAHIGLAAALQHQSLPGEAADVLAAAQTLFPDNPAVIIALAEIKERSGDADAAAACWRDARRACPDNPDVLRGMISMLIRAGRNTEAERQLVLGQTMFPAVPWFIQEDARFAERQGNWVDAEAIWRRAVEQFPEERECHFGLAGALREAGELIKAAEVLSDMPGPKDSAWLIHQARLLQVGGEFHAESE